MNLKGNVHFNVLLFLYKQCLHHKVIVCVFKIKKLKKIHDLK